MTVPDLDEVALVVMGGDVGLEAAPKLVAKYIGQLFEELFSQFVHRHEKSCSASAIQISRSKYFCKST